ncbi:hypothetical protein A2U01_0040716, partial [Trifolium medium]|nr:hypothetical protein [Trifolium medium]
MNPPKEDEDLKCTFSTIIVKNEITMQMTADMAKEKGKTKDNDDDAKVAQHDSDDEPI